MARNKLHPAIKSISSSDHRTTQITSGPAFTPGPWTAGPQNIAKIDGGFSVHRIPISGGGQAIAAVWNGSVGKEFMPTNGDANARLIAAAPELYGALQFIVTELVQHCDHSAPKNPVMYALNRARGALAKVDAA